VDAFAFCCGWGGVGWWDAGVVWWDVNVQV
jgi:hypothetical protein